MIGRRRFLAALAGTAVSPLPALAQGKVARIGWLSPAASTTGATNLDALRSGLTELGYVEGRNIVIERRWADGNAARLPALAAELVRLKVDVICTAGSQPTVAAKDATSTIPIVFANVAFPDQQRLVASYARPGGNVTGVAFIGPEYGKRLELLKEVSPKLGRVALLYNPGNPGNVLAVAETKRWAQALGVTLEPHAVRGAPDLERVFAAIAGKRPDALMTTADVLIIPHRARIADFAAKHRLLSMYPDKEYVEVGGLMSYGGSIPDMYRRAATYVDRILKGAKPSDLPVEQPAKFDLVVNLKTARGLELTVPQSVILRADQVID